ncbi:MAG: hypothetical protein IKV61_04790 [Clostridia bacterium]|nr:hypothetical protein [Clostridia bacterium]
MAETILTPITLWNTFDDTLPLKEVQLNTFTLNNAVYSQVYFSGRQVGLERVRIFGLYAMQKQESKGSILILPDVVDTIDGELVNHFVNLGYDVLSVDLRGKFLSEGECTKYPDEISYANYASTGDTFYSAPNLASETCWYEWTAVSRYAVSYLKSKRPENKIGVIGIRNASNVLWQLSATDSRVDASTFLFGAGWLAYKGISKFDEKATIELNEERYRYIAGIEAQSYATYVKCPVLYLSTTNSDQFDAERALDTLSKLPNQDKYWFNFTTVAKEVLDGHSLIDIELFFAKFIAGQKIKLPSIPELEIDYEDEHIIYNLNYSNKKDVSNIFVLSSSNDLNTCDRVWYNVTPKVKPSGEVVFRQKVYGKVDFEIAFAVIKYNNGFTVSSKLEFQKVDLSSSSKTPSVLFSSFKQPVNFIVEDLKTPLLGNVFAKGRLYRIKEGPFNIAGIYSENTLTSYAVRKIADSIEEDSFIKFDAYSPLKDCLLVKITLNNKACYEKSFYLNGGEFWQSVQLPISEFKDESAKGLKNFEDILSISISSSGAFMINNFILI